MRSFNPGKSKIWNGRPYIALSYEEAIAIAEVDLDRIDQLRNLLIRVKAIKRPEKSVV